MPNNKSFDPVKILKKHTGEIVRFKKTLDEQNAKLAMAICEADIMAALIRKTINWKTGEVTDLKQIETNKEVN